MRKWTWRKLLIHAALEFRNPLGWILADEFVFDCICGQDLHETARLQRRAALSRHGEGK